MLKTVKPEDSPYTCGNRENCLYAVYHPVWILPRRKKLCLALLVTELLVMLPSFIDCIKSATRHVVCRIGVSSPMEFANMTNEFNCIIGQRACKDGSCILDLKWCDGVTDCEDKTDEMYCVDHEQGDICGLFMFSGCSTKCLHWTFVFDFTCDCMPDCEDEQECVHETKSLSTTDGKIPTYYRCLTTGKLKTYPNFTIPSYMINDLVEDCQMLDDELEIQDILKMNERKAEQLCSENMLPCLRFHPKCYHREHQCKYDISENGHLKYCRNGGHLRNCKLFPCPVDYFTCPGSYCIPWRFVCDGKLDCIDNHDEKHCANYICRGMLHCRSQSYCIHQNEVCDGTMHCPENEDEINCDIPDCPKECICQGKAYICTKQQLAYVPFSHQDDMTIKYIDLSNNNLSASNTEFLRLP